MDTKKVYLYSIDLDTLWYKILNEGLLVTPEIMDRFGDSEQGVRLQHYLQNVVGKVFSAMPVEETPQFNYELSWEAFTAYDQIPDVWFSGELVASEFIPRDGHKVDVFINLMEKIKLKNYSYNNIPERL